MLYRVHTGATWRIQLNYTVRCGIISNYSDHLLLEVGQMPTFCPLGVHCIRYS